MNRDRGELSPFRGCAKYQKPTLKNKKVLPEQDMIKKPII